MDLSGIRESLPEVGEPSKKVCAVCQAPADKSCSACHKVAYCSAEHQKSDWKAHKKACSPIRIVSSPELGPHFVATRDIYPWSLLLTELPVLVNPYVIFKDYPASCISCRSILPSAPWPCFKCLTPYFCNLSCSMNKVHSQFECEILSECSEAQREKMCVPTNLAHLRAIHLKNNDPQTWAKVLDIRGTEYKPGDACEHDKWFIQEILPLLGEKGEGFEADMAKLQGIYGQKGIVVHPKGNSLKGGHGESQLIYLEASNFVQNCFANCFTKIGKGPQFQLEVRTTVEVKKGQIPSIDFMGMSYMLGAIFKQHINHKYRGALCICPRCSDPTELGTMQSAVKCRDGYLLPVDPMNMAENATWRCNCSGCKGKEFTWAEIEKLTSKLKLDVAIFQENVSVSDVERISKFLESLKKKLHPNHTIVLKFETHLTYEINSQMIGRGMRFSLPRMDLHISMIEHILRMVEIVDPGLSATRANYLTQLFNGLNHRLLWDPQVPRTEQRRLMERTIKVIDTLLPVAKYFPDIWTPPNIQYPIARRRILQMALNSTN